MLEILESDLFQDNFAMALYSFGEVNDKCGARHVIALSSVAGIFFVFLQAPVVQTLNSAIHRINHYPADRYELIALSTG